MFEISKRRRISQQVKDMVPAPVIDQILELIKTMNHDHKLVDPSIAVVFSDDYDADNIYIMILQQSGDVAEEFTLTYSGENSFLGLGTILIIRDKPKTVTIDLSDLNKDK